MVRRLEEEQFLTLARMQPWVSHLPSNLSVWSVYSL